MRKIFYLALALLLASEGVVLADLQVDRGNTRGQSGAVSKFFVARNPRPTGISADRVVVWDSNSNDGVSVTTTTVSPDNLVVGVTIDAIPGITSDATAANSGGTPNWGRVKIYGRHADVLSVSDTYVAGQMICTSGTAGAVARCPQGTTSSDFAVALESGSALTALDISVK